MDWYLARSGSNVENVMDETCIRLRGLPYGCTKADIAEFFAGMNYHFGEIGRGLESVMRIFFVLFSTKVAHFYIYFCLYKTVELRRIL